MKRLLQKLSGMCTTIRLMLKLNFAGPIAVSLELPDVVCNPRYSFLEGSPGTVACTVFSSKAKAESGQLVVQWIKVSITYALNFFIRTSKQSHAGGQGGTCPSRN